MGDPLRASLGPYVNFSQLASVLGQKWPFWPGIGTWKEAKWDTWMVCGCSGRDNNVISSEKSHNAPIQFAYGLFSQCPFFAKVAYFQTPRTGVKTTSLDQMSIIPGFYI